MLPDSDEDEDGGDDSEIKFTATLDSGCDDNWISWTKMEEHHLGTDKVESLTDRPGQLPSEFSDFNGNDVEPVGQVQLRWRASGSGRSDESVFYVIDNEDAPFDVLFGRTCRSFISILYGIFSNSLLGTFLLENPRRCRIVATGARRVLSRKTHSDQRLRKIITIQQYVLYLMRNSP